MKIVTITEITLSSSDLENLLREKGLVSTDLSLKRIVSIPGSKGLRMEFEKITETSKTSNVNPIATDKDTFLNTPLKDLDLSNRTFNCLNAARIKTPKELLEYPYKQIQRFRNFGEKSFKEINGILGIYGLAIKKE